MGYHARLPNRREQDLPHALADHRFPDGRLAEIFLTNGKCGSDSDVSARDVCSIALQFGAPLDVIRKALMRDRQGRPSGPLGVVLDLLARKA